VKDLNQILLNVKQALSYCSIALHFETPEMCCVYPCSNVGDKKKRDVLRFKAKPSLKILPFMLHIKNSMTVLKYHI
jgi:hypothetical protein